LPPSAGNVTVKGIDVAVDPVAVQKNIGYMPENTPLYEDMTVSEFLRFIAEIRGFSGNKQKTGRGKQGGRAFRGCHEIGSSLWKTASNHWKT